ncbi:hypothetical protein VP01_1286g1 [Puccinia sorghi]|uniref:Uncharacterized protein n=1 Tax=Puccinia sorghi TaxID=27349 RepID=A0A0L6VQ53_9BASI|nr:hypothetical protein VP01_1286g1 [Puccinia sorghi]
MFLKTYKKIICAHLAAMSDVYGGTYCYLNQVANQLGIKSTLVVLGFTGHSPQAPNWPLNAYINPSSRGSPTSLGRLASFLWSTILFYRHTINSLYGRARMWCSTCQSDVVLGVIISCHWELIHKMRFLQNANGVVPLLFDSWPSRT